MISIIVVNRDGASLFALDQPPDVYRHYGGRSMLEGCLAGLSDVPGSDLIVVDNGSRDGSAALVRARFPSARLIVNPGNLGFAPAVCQAAAEARGDSLLLVNSDVVLDAPRVARLAEEMARRPGVGVLTCRTVYPGGTEQCPASRAATAAGVVSQLLGLAQPHDRTFDAARYGEPDWVAGGVLLIRRACWDVVGGFDPGFVFYEEDADFCLRARRAGWRVAYTPEVTAMHVRAATAGRERAFAIEHRYRSLLRYARKHFTGPGFLAVRAAAAGRLTARASWAAVQGEPGVARAALRVAGAAVSGRI